MDTVNYRNLVNQVTRVVTTKTHSQKYTRSLGAAHFSVLDLFIDHYEYGTDTFGLPGFRVFWDVCVTCMPLYIYKKKAKA